MQHVLVTGGAGYIGSHVCKKLKKEGFLPVIYDSLVNGSKNAVKWGPLVEGDISDRKKLLATFREYQPIAVMHFAAHIDVRESVANPLKYYQNNVGGTLTLLSAMQEAHIEHFIFSSTAAVYGNPKTVPIPEEATKNPMNPYGKSKWIVEEILKDLNFHFAILRYFNASGADRAGEIGMTTDKPTHLIPRTIFTALGKYDELKIFGDTFETRDGTAIRDYIHVEDLASAHVLAMKEIIRQNVSFELNLGTGKGYSVKEVIACVERVGKMKVPCSIAERNASEPTALVADATKAKKILGWEPQYSDLETIVQSAWKWHTQ